MTKIQTGHEIFSAPTVEHLALLEKFPQLPIYIYVNPVEYHGPHLSLHNDFILTQAFANLLHQQSFADLPFIEAPAIHFGHGPANGLGSVATDYSELKKKIISMVSGVWSLGYRRFIFMTFHGDPLHNLAIFKGVQFVISRGGQAMAPFNLVLHEFMNFKPGNFQEVLELLPGMQKEKDNILQNLYLDFHAGAFETSLVLALAPQNVSSDYLKLPAASNFRPNFIFSCLAKLAKAMGLTKLSSEFNFVANGLGWSLSPEYRGYTGFPALASKELGEYFVQKKILPMFIEEAERVFTKQDKPKFPIMRWVAYLSLGGRLGP